MSSGGAAVEPAMGTRARYVTLSHLGSGTYGDVYKIEDVVTKKQWADKKIKIGDRVTVKDGVNRSAYAEILAMRELNHINIVKLHDVYVDRRSLRLVLDLCTGGDLKDVLDYHRESGLVLDTASIKSYMLMTTEGLEYLHEHWILHRDMKPENILITANGVAKLADFGMACTYGSPSRAFTSRVCTIFYRAPELLFGAKYYTGAIDMWALGCIHAELILLTPFLAIDSDRELAMLEKIFEVLGTCTDEEWKGMTDLPSYMEFKPKPGYPFKSTRTTKGTFASSQDDEIEFLYGLFEKCPAKRLTARQALQHKYFSNDPPPMPHDQLNLGKDSSGGVGGDDSGGGGDADKGGASDEGAAPGGAGGGGGTMKRKYADDDGDDDGDDSGGRGSKPTKLAF